MTPAPEPIAYAPVTRPRRWPRVLALVVTALAVGVVGRLCWQKFSPGLGDHLTLLSAQRVLLTATGRSLDVSAPPPGTMQLAPVPTLGAWADPSMARASADFLAAHGVAPPSQAIVYHGPLANGDGQERIVCIVASVSPLSPSTPLTLSVHVFGRATVTRPSDTVGRPAAVPLATFRRSMQLEAPSRDVAMSNRLVFTGTRDGSPVRYALTLEKADVVTVVALAPPTTTPAKKPPALP